MRRKVFPCVMLLTALLSGCAVGPDFQRPEADVPAGWRGAGPSPEETTPAAIDGALADWWQVFGDPVLNGLVQRATSANLDLELARARVRQARAARAVAAGGLGPTLDGAASYQRSRSSATTSSASTRTAGVTGDQYEAGFDAGWEIDLFGGRRRTLEAADADLSAAVESLHDVLVSLTAEVARNYIQLRAYQQQAVITRQNLAAQQHSARLTRERFSGGFVSALDVANAEALVATTAAQLPLLEASTQQAIFSLGVLVGEPPAALADELSPAGAIPDAPPTVPVGVPSDLLRRRPDIRMAEANLHAATARIGVATAELFPKFTLSGSLGYRTADLGTLFQGASQFWAFGPSAAWRLFESGRIRANVEVQKALQAQEMITYRQTVLGALQEVENALVAATTEQQRRQALITAVAANRRAVALSEKLYAEGLTDFINVLQSQLSLLNTENALIQSTATVATDLVALYKALGGGWVPTDAAPQLPSD